MKRSHVSPPWRATERSTSQRSPGAHDLAEHLEERRGVRVHGALEGAPDQLRLRAADLRGGGGIREHADEIADLAVVVALGAQAQDAVGRVLDDAEQQRLVLALERCGALELGDVAQQHDVSVRPARVTADRRDADFEVATVLRVAGECRRSRGAQRLRESGMIGQDVLDAVADHDLARPSRHLREPLR